MVHRSLTKKGVALMLCKTLHAFSGLALAAIVVSLGAQSAAAASTDQRRLGKPLPPHHHLYARYRGPYSAPPAALPYAPEYGFLRRVPPNAIRGPGYTFVPGVGILGESCDLPTSACTNEYRDVH
jgi:hypothetical protein